MVNIFNSIWRDAPYIKRYIFCLRKVPKIKMLGLRSQESCKCYGEYDRSWYISYRATFYRRQSAVFNKSLSKQRKISKFDKRENKLLIINNRFMERCWYLGKKRF